MWMIILLELKFFQAALQVSSNPECYLSSSNWICAEFNFFCVVHSKDAFNIHVVDTLNTAQDPET